MKIGRYEILEEIGQGAMGTVYRARDPLIERTVALKTVPIAQLRQEGSDTESRFLREAQSAGRLSHPNIVTIYDVGEADGFAYIAMEYLPGATLRGIMNHGPMPLDLVLDTILQMAEALAFAHAHGVIHRDVKPSNVVVTGQGGRIKLTDFGIAHLANSEHTQAGQMLGSPRYMSPEQAMGKEVDGRSDIFSLGAVMYEMLTGHYAFDGDSLPTIVYRVIHESPPPATSLRPLPTELSDLLARMLNKAPDMRPDAGTVASTLLGLNTTSVAAPVSHPPQAARRIMRPLTFGILLAVLLAGVAAVMTDHFTRSLRPAPAGPQLPAPRTEPVPPPRSTADTPTGASGTPAAAEPELQRPPAPPPTDAYLAGLDKKRVELRIRRTELLLEYTERHPDVVQIDRQLEQLRIERQRYLRQLQKKKKP